MLIEFKQNRKVVCYKSISAPHVDCHLSNSFHSKCGSSNGLPCSCAHVSFRWRLARETRASLVTKSNRLTSFGDMQHKFPAEHTRWKFKIRQDLNADSFWICKRNIGFEMSFCISTRYDNILILFSGNPLTQYIKDTIMRHHWATSTRNRWRRQPQRSRALSRSRKLTLSFSLLPHRVQVRWKENLSYRQ